MAKTKKDKFQDLPEDWKSLVETMGVEQLKNELMLIVNSEDQNQKNKEDDQHLQEVKLAYIDAAAGYKEATKANKLKMKYVFRHLVDKGAI
jgi:16S rRNA C1402 (ribose-2'-O) methylase RsmI